MPRPGFRFPGRSRELVTAGALGGEEAGEGHRSPGTLPCTLPMSKGTSRTDARAGRQRSGDGCRTGAGLQEGRGQLCSTEASGVLRTFPCPTMPLDTPPPSPPPSPVLSTCPRALSPAWSDLGARSGQTVPTRALLQAPGSLAHLLPPGHQRPRDALLSASQGQGVLYKKQVLILASYAAGQGTCEPRESITVPPPTQGRPRLPLPLIFPLPIWWQHSCHHLQRSCMKQVLTERQSQQRRPHREQR